MKGKRRDHRQVRHGGRRKRREEEREERGRRESTRGQNRREGMRIKKEGREQKGILKTQR